MRGNSHVLVVAGALAALVGAAGRLPASGGMPADPSYEAYAHVLSTYVDARGLVDYEGLKKERDSLDHFVEKLSRLDRESYEAMGEKDRIAFWINVYNALTLRAIVDHYPIAPSKSGEVESPKMSIRQIDGVWDKLTFTVMGESVTLDHIEHGILRKGFGEPRIHMALVCAAVSCPPLRAEPYVGARFDEQLDDQTRRFLATPENFRIDREAGVVYLSSIFDWFGEDFARYVKSGAPGEKTPAVDKKDAAVAFVSRYVGEKDGAFLRDGEYRIEYLEYDWTLNDRGRE